MEGLEVNVPGAAPEIREALRPSRNNLLGMAFMVVFGLAFAVLGVLLVRPSAPEEWPRTDGTVVDLIEDIDSEGDTMYRPVVEYRDASGQTHRVRSSLSSSGFLSSYIGQTVEVAYDPADPDHGRIMGGEIAWAWLGFTGMGLLFAGIGLYLLVRTFLGRSSLVMNKPGPY